MTLRHKRVVGTLDTGTAADWNDDHHLDPTETLTFWTTFTEHVFADLWDVTQCTGAGTADVSNAGGHVDLILDTNPNNGDISSARMMCTGSAADITAYFDEPVVTMAVCLASVVMTSRKFEFGLFVSADTPFTANKARACFYLDGATLYAVTSDGVNETSVSLGTFTMYGVYRIELTETMAKFYRDDLDGVLASIATTLPLVPLTIKYSAMAGALGEALLYTDFCGLTRLKRHA
jgi:hypothetical protein